MSVAEQQELAAIDLSVINAICDAHEHCYACPLHTAGFCKDHACNTTPELFAFIEHMHGRTDSVCSYCGEPLLDSEFNNRLHKLFCNTCWDKINQMSPEPEVIEPWRCSNDPDQ